MKNSTVDAIQGGRWRCKLTVSSKFATSTIHGYTHSRVDVGWRCKLPVSWIGIVCRTKIQKLKGGRWPYKLRLWIETGKVYHTKIQKFKGGRCRYKLNVSLKSAKSTIQRYKNSRVDTLALQTYCVCLRFAKSIPYKDTNIHRWTLALQTYCVSLRFAKSNVQRYKNSRVDVGGDGATNLQCVYRPKI